MKILGRVQLTATTSKGVEEDIDDFSISDDEKYLAFHDR
jgi:hypothetical protein